MGRKAEVRGVHPAGPEHQVVTLDGGGGTYRRQPCAECPWRKDAPIGEFPVEAFRFSARTCYDMAESTFSCHVSGKDKPATCAGFLLSESAAHNMSVRLRIMDGRMDLDAVSSDVPLYSTYTEMAVANGVAPDDPVLDDVRTSAPYVYRGRPRAER